MEIIIIIMIAKKENTNTTRRDITITRSMRVIQMEKN